MRLRGLLRGRDTADFETGVWVTSFLSTFINKVDRKGRVSVPAPFRAALSDASYQGVIAYPSLKDPAIDVFGRRILEELNQRRLDKTLSEGEFEQALLGTDTIVDTIMAMAHELPFDGEGRILLPGLLAKEAGISDRATFVGRGTRFQIWSPDNFESTHTNAIKTLRAKLNKNRAEA